MAIRLRKVKGKGIGGYHWIALCAAESLLEEGDLYLDDGMHTALNEKFMKDLKEMIFQKTKKHG